MQTTMSNKIKAQIRLSKKFVPIQRCMRKIEIAEKSSLIVLQSTVVIRIGLTFAWHCELERLYDS